MSKREEELIELMENMTTYEKKYWSEGKIVIGVDEVGRGPLAGPVTVCAYAFRAYETLLGVMDSKKLSEKRREELYKQLIGMSKDYSIVSKEPIVIDQINILNATKLAMKEAVENLKVSEPCIVLVDAVEIPNLNYEQLPIIKGDQKSISIAAASIIAKVTRDRYMTEQGSIYPEYKFEKNKGYGTKEHMIAIEKKGLTDIHRRSFCKKFIDE